MGAGLPSHCTGQAGEGGWGWGQGRRAYWEGDVWVLGAVYTSQVGGGSDCRVMLHCRYTQQV